MLLAVKRHLIFGFLAALILIPKISQADASQYIQWGTQMLGQKKYDDAVKYFSGAIKADPKSATAYKGMGYALIGKGEQAKALPYLKYSAQLNPADSALQQYISTLSGGSAPPALPGSQSSSEKAYQNGALNMQVRKYPYAAYYFDQATKADPNSAKAWEGLGSAYYAQGLKDKALIAWERSLAVNPSNPQLAQDVAILKAAQKQAAVSPVSQKTDASVAQTKPAFNPWIMTIPIVALGAIMLFLF